MAQHEMTRDEFLKLLELHGKGKFVNNFGHIRHIDEDKYAYCPITFLCDVLTGDTHPVASYPTAARKLGLSHGLMNTIVDAADGSVNSRALRSELFQILGLTGR